MITTNIYKENKKTNYIECTLNGATLFEMELCEESVSLIYDFSAYKTNTLKQCINKLQPEIEEILSQAKTTLSFVGICQLMKCVNTLKERIYLE